MNVLITGGSGFIGTALIKALLERGAQLWVLKNKRDIPAVSGVHPIEQLSDCPEADAVINLAGAPIADARWSDERKALLCSSRIDTTQKVVEWIEQQTSRPSVLISGSAIGYYGAATREPVVTEETNPVLQDFSHTLCQSWEDAALAAEPLGVRVALLRTGIVLGPGGALAKMRLPFMMGMGGPIASGNQWMPWIHLSDEIAAILHLLDNETLSGPFNLTAPRPVRNRDFTKALGQAVKRPTLLPMPAFGARLMLGDEASRLLTEGLPVHPDRLLNSGFEFQYTEVEPALADAIAAF